MLRTQQASETQHKWRSHPTYTWSQHHHRSFWSSTTASTALLTSTGPPPASSMMLSLAVHSHLWLCSATVTASAPSSSCVVPQALYPQFPTSKNQMHINRKKHIYIDICNPQNTSKTKILMHRKNHNYIPICNPKPLSKNQILTHTMKHTYPSINPNPRPKFKCLYNIHTMKHAYLSINPNPPPKIKAHIHFCTPNTTIYDKLPFVPKT